MSSTPTTPTTPVAHERDDRAARIERRLARAILTTRAACTAATVAGWGPSDGDTALHLMRLGGMAHVALKGLAGVPTCPACDEPYGYHPPSCALAPYLRAAVDRASPSAAHTAAQVRHGVGGTHPDGADGAYLVCAPDLAQRLDVVPHTALLVGAVDLDVLPHDTFVWPIALPVVPVAAPATPPPSTAEDADPQPDDVARFVAAYRAAPRDVLARLSRNPLRTLAWSA